MFSNFLKLTQRKFKGTCEECADLSRLFFYIWFGHWLGSAQLIPRERNVTQLSVPSIGAKRGFFLKTLIHYRDRPILK